MRVYINPMQHKQIRVGPYTTSKIELIDLVKSWVAIAVAFAILRGGLNSGEFVSVFIFSAITVGVAFIFHELAHKIAAQRYGCFAEFRCNDMMLVLAILMSFAGFVFFAPGAVLISGPVGKKRNGIISAVGPGINFALAILCLVLLGYVTGGWWAELLIFSYIINSWIGLFNLIPVWMFDGKKILAWSKPVYFSMLAIALILVFGREVLVSIL